MKLSQLKIDMKVRYHPIIGLKHDGKVWTIRGTGEICGRDVVWLDGKSGCVAVEAISLVKPGLIDNGMGEP